MQLKIKNQLNQYFTNLKKLQKSDYDPELVQKINENLEQIKILTEQLEKAKKTKFEEGNEIIFKQGIKAMKKKIKMTKND
jgi:hypothetical protein